MRKRTAPLLLLLLPASLAAAAAAGPAAAATTVSLQCTLGTERSGSGTTANWPTYHFMNNVTRNASGVLFLEPLNDANAIAEYKGKPTIDGCSHVSSLLMSALRACHQVYTTP